MKKKKNHVICCRQKGGFFFIVGRAIVIINSAVELNGKREGGVGVSWKGCSRRGTVVWHFLAFFSQPCLFFIDTDVLYGLPVRTFPRAINFHTYVHTNTRPYTHNHECRIENRKPPFFLYKTFLTPPPRDTERGEREERKR